MFDNGLISRFFFFLLKENIEVTNESKISISKILFATITQSLSCVFCTYKTYTNVFVNTT